MSCSTILQKTSYPLVFSHSSAFFYLQPCLQTDISLHQYRSASAHTYAAFSILFQLQTGQNDRGSPHRFALQYATLISRFHKTVQIPIIRQRSVRCTRCRFFIHSKQRRKISGMAQYPFVGVHRERMNTYDAELVKEDGKYAVVLESAKIVLSEEKQAKLSANNVQPQTVVLGVRPEHITLVGDTDKMVQGVVDVTEMMGSAVHVHATACGKDTIIIVQTMDLAADQKDMLNIGAAMAFTFGGDVAHVFDPETGKNLEA